MWTIILLLITAERVVSISLTQLIYFHYNLYKQEKKYYNGRDEAI